MDLQPFDIIVFRKKNLVQSMYSMITLDLDNHVGTIIEINNKLYLNHFIILNFRHLLCNAFFNTSYKCGTYTLTPIEKLVNDEMYVYRSNEKITCKRDISKILVKAKAKLNYLSNLKLLVGFFLNKNIFRQHIKSDDFQNHTCISYLMWFLNECGLYNFDFIDNDFYKKRVDMFNGLKNRFELVHGYNVGKKDLSKFNPYSLSYLLAFIFNFICLPQITITNIHGEYVPWYIMLINLCVITPICTIHGRHCHLLWNWNGNGRRYIGVVIMYIFLSIILLEYNLHIDKHMMTYIAYLMFSPRIMMTRFASWLCNDIKGTINPLNKRPYDVALYESIWEGLVPTLFILCSPNWISYKIKNTLIATNYSISRFIIEFYKPKLLNNSLLTLGQIDSILNFIFLFWYIHFSYTNFYQYIFHYSLLFLFYLDTCFRFSVNKFNYTINIGNCIILDWKTTYNKGFYNGYIFSNNKIMTLFFPFPMLCLSNYFLMKHCIVDHFFNFFNLFALLNIFERYVNGYVTDYLRMQLFSLKTFNLNFADIVINIYLVMIFLKILKFN